MSDPHARTDDSWTKVDVVRHLHSMFGYLSYLEIATTTTGFRFGEASQSGFNQSLRLMYKCPAGYDDGHPIDFRSPGLDISNNLASLAALSLSFDLVFVDSHHTYDCSLRDLKAAWTLLAEGGAMVVHDCNPPHPAMTMPEFRGGAWCGVTYQAFIDLVLGTSGLSHCTVDTDYGCGVILKHSSDAPIQGPLSRERTCPSASVMAGWHEASQAGDACGYFFRHRTALLNLLSISEFCARTA